MEGVCGGCVYETIHGERYDRIALGNGHMQGQGNLARCVVNSLATYHTVNSKKIEPSLTTVARLTLGSNSSVTLSSTLVGCGGKCERILG